MALANVGCFRAAPRIPKVISSPPNIFYTENELKTDIEEYRKSMKAGTIDVAKTERNQIVYRVLAQIDSAYGRFEVNLTTSRAAFETSGDAASLGITAAASILADAGVKDILSATATAFQGTRVSFDKNVFEQKTTEALISQMRASRKTLEAQMIQSLTTRDATSYPLEAAWTDLVSYYYVGTLPSALVAIASRAGSDDVKADQTLASAKELITFTPAQALTAILVRGAYTKLSQELNSADTASAAMDSLKRILTAAGVSFNATMSSADILAVFRSTMAAAASDPALLDKLGLAVTSVLPH